MTLRSIDYKQFIGKPAEWHIEGCTFDMINLIVGKNASGKTMTLNIIRSLSDLLSRHRKLPFVSGNYIINFIKNSKEIEYVLEYDNTEVLNESLKIGSNVFLKRGSDGKGKIYAQEIKKEISFQVPNDEIAAFVKRDAIQHPFLQDLYNWGDNLIPFSFGTTLGSDYYAATSEVIEIKKQIDLRDTKLARPVFKKGESQIGEKFLKAVSTDMSTIGYSIDNIKIGPISGLTLKGLQGLLVKESDLEYDIEQQSISQGMFRAMSLIIQLNYALVQKKLSCILIDDIGEGLDYDRSSKLIKLIMGKAKKYNIQLIMSTNDRFVMNNVPLKYWSVIVRRGNIVRIYNYRNSREYLKTLS